METYLEVYIITLINFVFHVQVLIYLKHSSTSHFVVIQRDHIVELLCLFICFLDLHLQYDVQQKNWQKAWMPMQGCRPEMLCTVHL